MTYVSVGSEMLRDAQSSSQLLSPQIVLQRSRIANVPECLRACMVIDGECES